VVCVPVCVVNDTVCLHWQTLSTNGTFLERLCYHEGGFASQRLGALSCLDFHRSTLLLAAGANDPLVAVFEGKQGD
jgi:hypothetical protein